MAINSVCLSGNVCSDPRFTTLRNESEVMNLQLAVNERHLNKDTGEWESIPNFVPVVYFGKNLDFFKKNVSTGSKLTLHGKLRWSQWDSKDEQGNDVKRSKLEVIADTVEVDTGTFRK